jgi:hypothetical protein
MGRVSVVYRQLLKVARLMPTVERRALIQMRSREQFREPDDPSLGNIEASITNMDFFVMQIKTIS